jgi:hypothetical protein
MLRQLEAEGKLPLTGRVSFKALLQNEGNERKSLVGCVLEVQLEPAEEVS